MLLELICAVTRAIWVTGSNQAALKHETDRNWKNVRLYNDGLEFDAAKKLEDDSTSV